MKNRYLVFEYSGYYPMGGMGDLKSRFDSEEDARAELLRLCSIETLPGHKRSDGGEVYDRQEDRMLQIKWDYTKWTWDSVDWEPLP